MSSCVWTPRKPKLYVAMADASCRLFQIEYNPYFVHVQKENFHGYTFILQVTKPIFKSIPEHSEH